MVQVGDTLSKVTLSWEEFASSSPTKRPARLNPIQAVCRQGDRGEKIRTCEPHGAWRA
jgi:hypothetical protein